MGLAWGDGDALRRTCRVLRLPPLSVGGCLPCRPRWPSATGGEDGGHGRAWGGGLLLPSAPSRPAGDSESGASKSLVCMSGGPPWRLAAATALDGMDAWAWRCHSRRLRRSRPCSHAIFGARGRRLGGRVVGTAVPVRAASCPAPATGRFSAKSRGRHNRRRLCCRVPTPREDNVCRAQDGKTPPVTLGACTWLVCAPFPTPSPPPPTLFPHKHLRHLKESDSPPRQKDETASALRGGWACTSPPCSPCRLGTWSPACRHSPPPS